MTDLKEQARRLIELDGEWSANFDALDGRLARRGKGLMVEPDDTLIEMAWGLLCQVSHAPAIAHAYLDQCEENERLRSAIADKGGTEHAPTQWAYDQACSALEKHRAENERLREALKRLASSEAFHVPKVMTEEERQRVEFARKALGDTDV